MPDKLRFRPISFTPHKLVEARKYAEKKYKDAEEHFIRKLSQRKMPNLLAKIRAIPQDPETVRKFALSLSKIEVRILIYEYPYYQEEKETMQKIILILMICYRKEIGRKAWEIYQNQIKDPYLPKLLHFVFRKEDPSFLGLDHQGRQELTDAFSTKKDPIHNLSTKLVHTDKLADDVLDSWKIKPESMLQLKLIKEMLVEGLVDDHIINREGALIIKSYLDRVTLEDYKDILKKYITHRDYQQFDKEMMIQAIQKLGEPRHHDRPWQFLSKEELNKVKQWIMHNDLQTFFSHIKDNRRFNYWKKYLEHMRDVKIFDEPLVVCMDFGAFVVVEFGRSGAAYFYHQVGFYEVILKYVNQHKRAYRSLRNKEHLFKYRDEYERDGYKLYIHRLPHSGYYWDVKFDQHMLQYLHGNFNYQG